MEDEVSAGRLAQLLGITPKTLGGLAKNGIAGKGKRRGTYVLEASVGGYCKHLRAMAAGRGGEAGASARERLGAAQADLTETKARQLRGELVEAIKVEKLWTSKLKAFPNRILAIPHREIYRPGKSFVPRSMSLLRDKAPNVKGAIDEGST